MANDKKLKPHQQLEQRMVLELARSPYIQQLLRNDYKEWDSYKNKPVVLKIGNDTYLGKLVSQGICHVKLINAFNIGYNFEDTAHVVKKTITNDVPEFLGCILKAIKKIKLESEVKIAEYYHEENKQLPVYNHLFSNDGLKLGEFVEKQKFALNSGASVRACSEIMLNKWTIEKACAYDTLFGAQEYPYVQALNDWVNWHYKAKKIFEFTKECKEMDLKNKDIESLFK